MTVEAYAPADIALAGMSAADQKLILRLAEALQRDAAVSADPVFVGRLRAELVDSAAALAAPALSVRQSWAGLLAASTKPTENRSWECPAKYIGKPAWIHASAKADRDAPVFDDYAVPERLRATGRILALATITDCHLDAGCCRPWGQERCFHWQIADVRPLVAPLPAKGMLGFWRPPVDVAAEAVGQLQAVAALGRVRASRGTAEAIADDDLLLRWPPFPPRPTGTGAAR